jgi:hypothetical protein
MTQRHVLFSDVVPYDLPSALAALRGPADGTLTLPLHLWWAPGPVFDLTDRSELLAAYRAIVRDGRTVDQEELLNAALLVAVWPDLRLPVRCRTAWEDAFPELVT